MIFGRDGEIEMISRKSRDSFRIDWPEECPDWVFSRLLDGTGVVIPGSFVWRFAFFG